MSKDGRSLIDGFVAELAAVVSAMLGASVTPKATNGKGKAAKAADPWVVRVSASGAASKVLAVGFTRAAAGKLSARVMMMDSDPADAEITDTLKELVQQAIGALSLKPIAKGIEFTVQPDVESATSALAGATGFDLPVDGDLNVQIACVMEEGEAIEEEVAAAATYAAAGASSRAAAAPKDVPENLDVILDIDLPLSVRFGHAELTLDALTKLGPGSLIELARLPDDPVELLVNGKLVARGEVVVVGGNYGVRVHEVVSTEQRIRTLE
jgi:flagellar motor switch protein FliN/FliY